MNKKRKKERRNVHINKYESCSQAEKVAAELDREDKKAKQSTTPPPVQTISSQPIESNLYSPKTQTYRCIADLDYKTPQQARDCSKYIPPFRCSSMLNNDKICSVIESSQL